MYRTIEHFLNIKYEGERFTGGRLPLDVLADLQALEDILTTFSREIWLEENNRERMPNGYSDWFKMSLRGVGDGSAIPQLELSVLEELQTPLLPIDERFTLMEKAKIKFGKVLEAANDDTPVILSPTQIRNFNRFLTNLKPKEIFKYSSKSDQILNDDLNVISIDMEKRKRLLTKVTATYEQRIQGKARLKGVDENGLLRFFNTYLRDFSLTDNSRPPSEYGSNIGGYYEFDLTVLRRHDDSIHSVITIHDISLLEHPAIDAIDKMASLEKGWLDGYGHSISQSIRDSAKRFIVTTNPLPTFYAIAPTEEGGILLEYEISGWDYGIEFNADNSFTFFGIEMKGNAEFSDTYSANDIQLLQARIRESLSVS